MTACCTCAHHLAEASTAEARNAIRLRHLADLADGMGDHELAAVLRDQAVDEQLHASRLYELAAPPGLDLMTDEPIRTPAEILDAAILYARCRAQEASPSYADLARHPGCDEVLACCTQHTEACRAQVAALEALRRRCGT
jgi:rubrerythrin